MFGKINMECITKKLTLLYVYKPNNVGPPGLPRKCPKVMSQTWRHFPELRNVACYCVFVPCFANCHQVEIFSLPFLLKHPEQPHTNAKFTFGYSYINIWLEIDIYDFTYPFAKMWNGVTFASWLFVYFCCHRRHNWHHPGRSASSATGAKLKQIYRTRTDGLTKHSSELRSYIRNLWLAT